MSEPTTVTFDEFFRELHGRHPYPWQQRLAEQVVQGDWPGAIDLPTGSGKTACIDIAIFALACQASLAVEQRTAPRRLFFCVNRRVIVDEAHTRARHIAKMIWKAERDTLAGKPTLSKVAEALRILAGATADHEVPPIDVLELRGGVYRDSRWARSITQPTVVCTTLDQLGSRLLFRGYGVSPNAAPIQAALIAYDSLILLDEAHISEPFRQTLDNVQRYLDPQKWAEQTLGMQPLRVVPMTATPNNEMVKRGVLNLTDEDRQNEFLGDRLSASKPAELRETKNVVNDAIKAALDAAHGRPAAIGIIVNRIATARGIYDELRKFQREPNEQKRKIPSDAAIELVIGSMRPIDRDRQAERLRELVGPDRPAVTATISFVVATQCLEVGADYDFDVLITECASLDALRQRFGRLNRSGRKDAAGNPINAKAFVLANQKDIKPDDKLDNEKPVDPIYGNALARTWNWLNVHASDEVVDFGIDAFQQLLDAHGDSGQPPKALLAPSASLNAPVMMPAYIDFWCQTAPRPVPDPDVSLFIHGPQGSEPDVQVCWRADLVEDGHMTRKHWCDVVALLPPTSAECLSLPISRLRRWLVNQMEKTPDNGDVLGVSEADEQGNDRNGDNKRSLRHPGVLWRSLKNTQLITSPNDLRPGDTLVLSASAGDSRALGHLPNADHRESTLASESHEQQTGAIHDVAEVAFTRARDLVALRLHPSVRSRLPVGEALDDVFAAAAKRDERPTRREWSALLRAAAKAISDEEDEWRQMLYHLADDAIRVEGYPDQRGVVMTTRRRLNTSTSWFIRAMDEGDDESSRTQRDTPVALADHSRHVRDAAAQALAHLPLDAVTESSTLAAYLHDWGKADERFQAMLRRTDRTDAWLFAGATPAILAKSDGMPTSRAQRDAARDRAGLPAGFRHEMLSIQLAESSGLLSDHPDSRALILHLIAAHHGHARPFAPVVVDGELPTVEFEGISLNHEQRAAFIPSHRLDSGIAERFWSLTRRFGWWGLAYLEAVLRLADAQASAAEDAGKYDNAHADRPAEISA